MTFALVDESPEAHHFAQGLCGAVVLASALASFAGQSLLGLLLAFAVMAFAVMALAMLDLTTNIGVGCRLYFRYKMLRHRLNTRP